MEARQGRDLAPLGSVHDSHPRKGTHRVKPVNRAIAISTARNYMVSGP